MKLNTQAVSTHGKDITTEARALSSKLEEFIKLSNQSTSKLRDEAKKYETKELSDLANQSERIDVQLQKVQDTMKVIQAQDTSSDKAIATLEGAVDDARESFKNGFLTWSETVRQTFDGICHDLQVANASSYNTVRLRSADTDVMFLTPWTGGRRIEGFGLPGRRSRPRSS